MTGAARPFQILSLDGGGLKGLFSAAVLAELEQDHHVNVADHFDLVVGTSTGALVALALAAGVAPARLVDFYVEKGPTIFPAGRLRTVRQILRPKYSSGPLHEALTAVLGDKRLEDSAVRLTIPAYSLNADDVYVFKTPHHARLVRDRRETMVDVALATTAAPTYLPAFRLRNNRLVDGGVWANNPVLVGITEAIGLLGACLEDVRVLSLGTTDPVTRNPGRLDRGGIAQWAMPSTRLLLRAQALGHLHAAELLVGREDVVRVDAAVPDGVFALDRLDAAEIRGLAEDVSRRASEAVAPFFSHRAPDWRVATP